MVSTHHLHPLLHYEFCSENFAGPIVRIGPTEVHISDSEFYETIYSSAPFSKYYPHYAWMDADTAGGITIDHRLHRLRRSAISPYFSKQAVLRFVPEIQARLTTLCNRLNTEFKGKDRPVRADFFLACMALDFVMQISFARNYDFTSCEDFNPDYMKALKGITTGAHVFIYFPGMMKVMKALPESLVEWLDPCIRSVFTFRHVSLENIFYLPVLTAFKDIELQAKAMIELGAESDDSKDAAHPTIFKELVHSNLPPEEKTLERLRHEAQVIVGAGGETMQHAASVGICHVLLNEEILARLKKELLLAWPDLDSLPPSLQELEQLPYLTAVIQEG